MNKGRLVFVGQFGVKKEGIDKLRERKVVNFLCDNMSLLLPRPKKLRKILNASLEVNGTMTIQPTSTSISVSKCLVPHLVFLHIQVASHLISLCILPHLLSFATKSRYRILIIVCVPIQSLNLVY